jgi:hypothetical protein
MSDAIVSVNRQMLVDFAMKSRTPSDCDHVESGDCKLCKIMFILRLFDSAMRCLPGPIGQRQIRFLVQCSVGHKTVTDLRESQYGCRSCRLLSIINRDAQTSITLDLKCVFAHDESLLRFHCGASLGCTDDKIMGATKGCDQDFYVMPTQFNFGTTVYSCDDNHWSNFKYELCTTKRVFELIFDARFDDFVDSSLLFTGYNSSLRIAFLHKSQRLLGRQLSSMILWCKTNNVTFLYIKKMDTKAIIQSIIISLYAAGYFAEREPGQMIGEIYAKRRDGNMSHKMMESRCCHEADWII